MAEITVTISPSEAGPIGQKMIQEAHTVWNTQQFSASVVNDPANAGVTWDIAQGGGTIDSRGLYTPPLGKGKATVKATSVTDKTKSATAIVTFDDNIH